MTTKSLVRGNTKMGQRPYIEYEGVRYTGKVLTRNPHLIGQKLELDVDSSNIRSIDAYEEDGWYIDTLTAVGFSPLAMAQTLDERRAILCSGRMSVHDDTRRKPELFARHPNMTLPEIPMPNTLKEPSASGFHYPRRKIPSEQANVDLDDLKPISLDDAFSRLVREYPDYTEQTLELHRFMMRLTEMHEGLLDIIADLG